MCVNIFGSSGKHASAVNSNVGLGAVDRNFNQRLIMLSNKLAQKINKSGDTMEGDLKFVYKPESTCNSLSLGVEGMDRNHSMSILLGNIRNQIYHANGFPIRLLAEHGFEFNCQSGQITKFDHDIVLNYKHLTGLKEPVSSLDAVNKEYADSKLALAVNELIRKIYLNADSLSNLQTDMLSRNETQRGEINSYFDGKIATLITEQTAMLGKIQLNESSIVTLRRETNELVNTTKTSIESEYEQHMNNIRANSQTDMLSRIETQRGEINSYFDGKIATLITEQTAMLRKIQLNESTIVDLRRETNNLVETTKNSLETEYEQMMTNIRSRQEEINENINAHRTAQNTLRTRQTELRSFVEANRSIMDNLVMRANMSRFIRNNVGLIPTLNSSTNKTGFIVTASHNDETAWNVFNSSPGSF